MNSKLKDVKNIISAYRLSQYIRKYGLLHVCKNEDCGAYSKIVVDQVETVDKFYKKQAPTDINEYMLVLDLYDKKYFATDFCETERQLYIYLLKDGTKLTDNLLIPFTPINLWKEIWFEHKVVITLLYGAITSIFGGSLFWLIKLIRSHV